jgi:hypothetical protein
MTMAATAPGPPPQGTRSQRWLARLSFVLAALAIVSLAVVAGLKSLALLALGLAAAVSNNAYGTGDIAGLGRRARLDRGILGVVAVTVSCATQAVGLLRGRHARRLSVLTTKQIEITADAPQIPVGVDGESILTPAPVTCTVSPGALRVWVPHDRPGVPAPKPQVNWASLRQLARISVHPAQVASLIGGSDMAKKKKYEPTPAATTAGNGGEAGPAQTPQKMKRKEYERHMTILHGELVAMQEWVKGAGAKVCVVFEGRDTAGPCGR